MCAPTPSCVVALDVDGVLVDSHVAHTQSAWLTAVELWPDAFEVVTEVASKPWRAGARRAWAGGDWEPLLGIGAEGLPNWLNAKVQQLRPILQSDFDAVLLMRLCADEAAAAINTRSGARPLSVGEIATNWDDDLREVLLSRYGLPEEELERRYTKVRDRWISTDLEGWVNAHTFNRDAASVLQARMVEEKPVLYALTTGPKRFASRLLEELGIELDSSNILELRDGRLKTDALHELLAQHPTEKFVFIDDNAKTLRQAAADRRLFPAKLWFAAWGRSTPQQQALVATMPRVHTLENGPALENALRS